MSNQDRAKKKRGSKRTGWDAVMYEESLQLPFLKKLFRKHGLFLILTCEAVPEQYDVMKDNRQVGYFRLRGGRFTVESPDACDTVVYYAEPDGDGAFEPYERFVYMAKGMRALITYLNTGLTTLPASA